MSWSELERLVDQAEVDRHLAAVDQAMQGWGQAVEGAAKRASEQRQRLEAALPVPVQRLLHTDMASLHESVVDVNRSLVRLVRRYLAALRDTQEQYAGRRQALLETHQAEAAAEMYNAFKEELRGRLTT